MKVFRTFRSSSERKVLNKRQTSGSKSPDLSAKTIVKIKIPSELSADLKNGKLEDWRHKKKSHSERYETNVSIFMSKTARNLSSFTLVPTAALKIQTA